MPDERRVPPGRPFRVTLLTGPMLDVLHVTRPSASGCAACRRPWAAHDSRDPFLDAACEQTAGAAAATVNRELAALERMFSLAVQGEQLQRMPYIEMLRENNARRGFFEREQFESVRAHLPAYARPAATFAYITGWRLKSEILPLQWRQVDFRAGIVRLDGAPPRTTTAGHFR